MTDPNSPQTTLDEDITSPDFFAGTRHWDAWRAARRSHPITWVESERTGGFLELRCLLAAMTRLVASIEVSGEVVRKHSSFLNGLNRLVVRLTPEPA
jgi:hypothetical protein